MFQKIKLQPTLIFFFIFSILVLATEPLQFGFYKKGHLGWVPSHVAAQVIKATPENGFVGFALKFEDNNVNDYYYFDRYPIFFSALTRTLLRPFENDLGTWVLMSKYWMDLIFIGTVFFGFLITGYLTKDIWKRLSITILSFSGYFFFQYKSMIHYDQPAILGMAALMEGIFHYERSKQTKRFVVWSIVAPLLGRGYASLFLLVLYFMYKLIFEKFSETLKLGLKTFIPGGLICSACLTYNIFFEAKIRNIPIDQVSIVISAKSRLGITKFSDAKTEDSVSFVAFTTEQIERLGRHLTPFAFGSSLVKLFLPLLIIYLFILAYRNQKPLNFKDKKIFILMLILSGPVWLFPMKRLAAPHDYTTMYYWAFGVAFFYTLVELIPNSKKVFVICCLILTASFAKLVVEKNKLNRELNAIAENLHEVRQEILKDPGFWRIYMPQGEREVLPGLPYSMGFYFHDFLITRTPRINDWVLLRENNKLKISKYRP